METRIFCLYIFGLTSSSLAFLATSTPASSGYSDDWYTAVGYLGDGLLHLVQQQWRLCLWPFPKSLNQTYTLQSGP